MKRSDFQDQDLGMFRIKIEMLETMMRVEA